MKLSDRACKAAKPRERQFKLYDGDGLYLLVKPNGSKLWQFGFRWNGKQRVASFGPYPEVSLARARDKRREARRQVREGVNPVRPKQDVGDSFRAMAEACMAQKGVSVETRQLNTMRTRLERDIYPEFGDDPIGTVTAKDVLRALRKIEDRGAADVARRVKQYVSQVFRYAIGAGHAARDVTQDLRGLLRARRRVRHNPKLSAPEIPDFLERLYRYDGDDQTRYAILFVLHTLVRTKELRFAKRTGEWDLDAHAPLWRVPAERMKMREDHIVPLTDQSRAILAILRDHDDAYLCPGLRGGAMSENTMLYALYRMGYKGKLTVHGLRGTASTVLNESGRFEPDWIERQLAHDERNKVRAAYNAAQYIDKRRDMMRWWSTYLAERMPPAWRLGKR